VARVADHVREDLFLGDNPHPDLIVGDLVLPPATLNGATLSFASLTPELLTDAGRLTSPAAQGARAGLRVTITSGAARREKDLSFGVLPGGRRLPVLRVEAAGTPRKDSTVPCLAELVEAGDARSGLLEGRLRLRGNSVLVKNKGRKVYYRIELARPRDVFGAGPTKVLLLTSAWRDVSLMRDRLCYDLFRGFSEPGRPRYSPHARYVELVVNGDYQGVYLLTDRIDADLLGFGKKSGRGAEHAVLYKAKDDRASFSELHEEAYVQKAPDWRDGEDWGPLAQLVGFVGQTPPKAFAAGIEGLVDVDEIIDFETLLLLRADREGRNYNLYVGRPPGPGARFFVVPWDCDMSFYHTDGASNALIHRLHQALPGYSRRANERWQALRRDRLSEKGLMARIDGLEAELAGAAGRNYRRWPLLPGWSWEGDVQTLREFLKTRLVTLDKVFQDAEDAAAARGM
ncbi:MAG TPA: CotH kinase family protein, partial [Candidatus Methanoperedens sp.]|nr:CotH kinase family protein [Candidatus Methanoperedens sp.]